MALVVSRQSNSRPADPTALLSISVPCTLLLRTTYDCSLISVETWASHIVGKWSKRRIQEMTYEISWVWTHSLNPSTTKTRIVAHSQLVVRADRESRTAVNANIAAEIVSRLKEELKRADAYVEYLSLRA